MLWWLLQQLCRLWCWALHYFSFIYTSSAKHKYNMKMTILLCWVLLDLALIRLHKWKSSENVQAQRLTSRGYSDQTAKSTTLVPPRRAIEPVVSVVHGLQSTLRKIASEIHNQKERECSRLVVYGVAFGGSYANWLTNSTKPFNETLVDTILRKHDRCFLTFCPGGKY